ncbi:MAG: protein kinase, partial [Anaerolineae bacterium]|nr:protein kinase [Anaerolineae bacterium]
MANLVGKTVDRYRIVAKLGRGGMAEVYKAYQPGLDRYVAIKVMLGHMDDDPDFVRRFGREARNVGNLRHPNIVQAYDFANEQGLYFMVMEYIDGPTLKEEIRARKKANKPFDLKEVAIVFTALCNAVDYAHKNKMIHRDIKPANVMITRDGQVVLTDFGIVRQMGATQHTATGALTGTPAYMSPEQGQGKKATEQSDIYALGVMLYEMVTGVVPFDAETPFAVIMKHVSEPLPLPTKKNPDLPPPVEQVILKTMSKKPEDRYQTAGELAKALRDAVEISYSELGKPLQIVAPPPKVTDIDHPTGPITAQERAATMGVPAGGATAVSMEEATVASTPPPVAVPPAQKPLPMMPIFIGAGGLIVLLIVGGIFWFSGDDSASNGTTVAGGGTTPTVETVVTDIPPPDPTDTPPPTQTPTPIPPGTPQAIVIADDAIEVRDGPGEEYRLLGLLPVGAEAEIVGRDREGAWWQVQTSLSGGTIGWIAAEFTEARDTASVPIALVPTITPTPIEAPTEEPTPEDSPTPEPTATQVSSPTPDAPAATNTAVPPTAAPTEPPAPAVSVSGKLAFPVDNGGGRYDV